MRPMTDTLTSWLMEGYFRITEQHPITGSGRIAVDKKNTIMYPSTLIMARGLAGISNSAVSHLYLSYSSNDDLPLNPYTISPSITSVALNSEQGTLRIPLSFPATITEDTQGAWTMANFNILVNQPGNYKITGSPTLVNGMKFYEAALVVQTDPNGSPSSITGDKMIARVAFERLTYDSAFNLTVSWGIKLDIT